MTTPTFAPRRAHLDGGTIACFACGQWLDPGQATRVVEWATGRVYAIHRYSRSPGCFAAAGPASRTRIEDWDPEAARAADLARVGHPGSHVDEVSIAAAIERNAKRARNGDAYG